MIFKIVSMIFLSQHDPSFFAALFILNFTDFLYLCSPKYIRDNE